MDGQFLLYVFNHIDEEELYSKYYGLVNEGHLHPEVQYEFQWSLRHLGMSKVACTRLFEHGVLDAQHLCLALAFGKLDGLMKSEFSVQCIIEAFEQWRCKEAKICGVYNVKPWKCEARYLSVFWNIPRKLG